MVYAREEPQLRIAVLGAGVVGLTAAIRLREAGHEVVVFADRISPETLASDRAGAIWFPWKVAGDRVRGWARESYQVLEGLVALPRAGVIRNEMLEYFRTDPGPDPWWAELVPNFERLDSAACPAGYVAGFRAPTLVIDCPVYMPFLMDRLRGELGCRVIRRRVEALQELCDEFPMVVNCGGLEEGMLANEGAHMFPRAGHTVRITPLAPGTPCVLDESDARELTYVIPRSSDCMLGGTDYENSADTTPDRAIADRILERCACLVPSVRAADELELRVGVRPGRRGGEVRLDGPIALRASSIVTCVGHGGVGHTLAWGCAREIVSRVEG